MSATFGDVGDGPRLRVGVLASQGDFAAHARMLRELGADAVEVRTPEALAGLDGLVIPAASRRRSPRRSSATGSSRRSALTSRPAARCSAPAPG